MNLIDFLNTARKTLKKKTQTGLRDMMGGSADRMMMSFKSLLIGSWLMLVFAVNRPSTLNPQCVCVQSQVCDIDFRAHESPLLLVYRRLLKLQALL